MCCLAENGLSFYLGTKRFYLFFGFISMYRMCKTFWNLCLTLIVRAHSKDEYFRVCTSTMWLGNVVLSTWTIELWCRIANFARIILVYCENDVGSSAFVLKCGNLRYSKKRDTKAMFLSSSCDNVISKDKIVIFGHRNLNSKRGRIDLTCNVFYSVIIYRLRKTRIITNQQQKPFAEVGQIGLWFLLNLSRLDFGFRVDIFGIGFCYIPPQLHIRVFI